MNTQETMNENSFAKFLAEFRDGESLSELSRHLADVVAAVRATGKAGSLTYTINIKPTGKGTAYVVEDDVKPKAPKEDRDSAIFYSTEDNQLVRTDPRQKEFALKTVVNNEEPLTEAANG